MTETEKRVPELRFEGFIDDWEQRKSQEIFQTITDYVANGSFASLRENVSYSEKKDFAIVVRLTDYSNNYNGPFLYTSESGYEFLKKSSLVKGDILISNVGANAGLVYKAPNKDIPMTLGPNSILVRSDGNDTEFLYQMMKTTYGEKKIKEQIGISAQPKFNKTEFRQIDFFLPSIDEQIQIGTFFTRLDDTIALHQRKLVLIKRLKQTYLDALFPQNDGNFPVIRFSAFSDSWEEHKFSDIVNRVSVQSNDSNLPKVEFEDIVSGEGRLNKDISQKFDSRKGTVFEPEFILYGKLRPYLKNWLFPNFKGIALGDFWVFEPKNPSIFKYYLIQSDRYQTAANLSSGTKMPRSDWKIVSETVFNIPNSIEEQEKIGFFFKQLDEVIDLHQCKLEKLIELKKVLLRKMFL